MTERFFSTFGSLVNRKVFLAFFGHLLILGLSKKKGGRVKCGDSAHDIPEMGF